ncbi:hypothetical protein JCM14713_12060 [Desulfomicrobium salsuginis]
MQIVPIRCFKRRCLRLKIVDFENTPITELVHPETGEEVGDLRVVAYDADGLPLGEHVYAKGASTLDLCRMDRGWAYLEFKPLIHSGSRILAANKVSETRQASYQKGVTRTRRGLLEGFWWKSGAII